MNQVETNRTNGTSLLVLRKAFREYYFNFAKQIEVPNRIKEREIGFARFGSSGMTRHLSFRNIGELVAALITEVPSDVYCSNSYYRFPTLPMQEKQWEGADMIFDIDGKDLDLECIPSHSFHRCKKCSNISPFDLDGRSHLCSKCQSEEAESISIPCERCIKAAKKQTKHLISILIEDFGVHDREISTYFSGNNGFHIHIRNNKFVPYDSTLRTKIISYVLGKGLMAESIGVRKDGISKSSESFRIKFPKGGHTYGWRKRVAIELGLVLNDPSEVKLRNIVSAKGGYEGFKKEIGVMTHKMGSLIDPQVTSDIHRVFRMPGTLNSKSSLVKIKCENLDSFDPFMDACLIGGQEVDIRLKTPVNVQLRRKRFKLGTDTDSLPLYVATYLICKGLADAV